MDSQSIGCCGAFCGTCPVLKQNLCQGCKLGYDNGRRDIKKARCKMKVCCIGRKLDACGQCPDYSDCQIINDFYSKKGYKYKKYKEANDYINQHGTAKFVKNASTWTAQYGKLSEVDKPDKEEANRDTP